MRALAAALLAALSAAPVASWAEPASSPASQWTNFPVASDAALKDPLQRRGKEVFAARCALCHAPIPVDMRPGMPAMPGTQALKAKYQGEKPPALEDRRDLTPAIVRTFVRRGGGFMPSFRPTEVSEEDLAALGAYLSRKTR
jgi:mono/diheme cytochrome c family protein